eukprot:59202-Pelagomonas_calceolata.AAC.1
MTCLSVTHAYEHTIGNACFIAISAHRHSVSRQNKSLVGNVPHVPILPILKKQSGPSLQKKQKW